MRYLKQKIAKANEHQKLLESSRLRREKPDTLPEFEVKIEIPVEVKMEENSGKKNKSKRSVGNNVMKNYAGAMVTFALSRASEPYLTRSPLIKTMSFDLFREKLVPQRPKIISIKNLRERLVIDESKDSEETKAFKGLFREACKAFLKHYWVKWIYNSKLEDKPKYLNYRGRLLRRVQNPELFTYLESFSTKKLKKQKSKKDQRGLKLE